MGLLNRILTRIGLAFESRQEVILVDENDTEVGSEEKIEAHRQGLLHRAFSIFILNNNGQLLLQKRAAGKYHSAGLWSNTCCSHPRPGEETIGAANRRLTEEMGLKTELKEAFTFTYRVDFENGLTENEYDHVFIGYDDGPPTANPKEVEQWKYLDAGQAFRESVDHPEMYTPWFKIVIPKVIEYLSDKQ